MFSSFVIVIYIYTYKACYLDCKCSCWLRPPRVDFEIRNTLSCPLSSFRKRETEQCYIGLLNRVISWKYVDGAHFQALDQCSSDHNYQMKMQLQNILITQRATTNTQIVLNL